MHIPQRKERGFVRYDQAAPLQTDERDKQAYADGYRMTKTRRNGVHDGRSQAAENEHENNDALYEDDGHGHAPIHSVLPHAQRERNDGVDAHARRERDRPVGHEAHDRRHGCCAEACRGKGRLVRNAGRLEQRRIDGDDIGHGQKRRKAADELVADRTVAFGDLEK